MVVIEDDVTDLEVNLMELEGDVNFLFDEQVIQDERLLNLEETSNGIITELDIIGDELDGKLTKFSLESHFAFEGTFSQIYSQYTAIYCILFHH